jgi:hypothetical protein
LNFFKVKKALLFTVNKAIIKVIFIYLKNNNNNKFILMKKFVLAIAIIFSLNAVGQTATKPATGDKVVTKTLYTPKEKEEIRKRYLKEVDGIGMSPTVKTEYLAIVNKYGDKLIAANKDRKLTQTQATTKVNKLIKDQNQEIKSILTPDQYKKHKMIFNRYQNSINYRIETK